MHRKDLGSRRTRNGSLDHLGKSAGKRRVPLFPVETKWWQRLQLKMYDLGWSKAELARRSGVAYDSINKYLRGGVDKPRGDILDQLSRAVGHDTKWLLFGEAGKTPFLNGAQRLENNGLRHPLSEYSGSLVVDDISRLKLVGWGDLARFVDSEVYSGRLVKRISDLNSSQPSEQVVISVPDNSMAPDFRRGDLIICGLGLRPKQDDLVIASVRLKNGISYYFRKYGLNTSSGSDSVPFILHPLNKAFPEIKAEKKNPPRIIGKIIGYAPVEVRLFDATKA
jgi:transcriptional regulator with XRE-family HTH domain